MMDNDKIRKLDDAELENVTGGVGAVGNFQDSLGFKPILESDNTVVNPNASGVTTTKKPGTANIPPVYRA